MSTSEQALVQLDVQTGDPATEISVFDGQFRPVQHGLGTLRASLSPGIYKVKVRAGFETREDYVVLRAGDPPVVKPFPPLQFSSPAPLWDTAKTHEFHVGAAGDESRKVHVQAGAGSTIFVFARDWTSREPPATPLPSYPHPARGLSLRDAQGGLVADLVARSANNLGWDAWSACNVQVAPGVYRLRLELSTGATLEQAIIATAGWQTQIFLLQRQYGTAPDDRRADLPGAAILLARGMGFEPGGEDMRLAELARLGLTNHRQVLSEELRQLLVGKFDNPMLGIYAAHLLLLDDTPDLALLRIVVTNLRGLLGAHPDVEALALRLDPAGGYVFANPPMLRRSWEMIVSATIEQPKLVPQESLAASIADRIWGNDLWLMWMSPPEVTGGVLAPDDEEPGPSEIEAALTAHLQRTGYLPSPQQGIGEPTVLSPDELAEPITRDITPPPALDDEAISRLVQMLGIPRSNVEELVGKIDQQWGR